MDPVVTDLILEPLLDYLIVEVHKATAGPLIVPDSVEIKTPIVGTVQAAGPGYWQAGTFIPTHSKPGDVVLLQFGAGTDVRLGEKVYKMVLERDLFGKFKATA